MQDSEDDYVFFFHLFNNYLILVHSKDLSLKSRNWNFIEIIKIVGFHSKIINSWSNKNLSIFS